MSQRDPESEADMRFDNWPVENRSEYADWDVERAAPETEGGSRELLVEEYRAGMADDEDDWFGYVGQTDEGGPLIYAPHESALYRGEVDDDDERIVLREENRRDVEEESLGEHVERIGEEHDWEWLSSFARNHLEDDADREDRSPLDHQASEFQQRNVLDDDPHDLSFFGSHTYADENDRVHTIDRYFDVYLDDPETVDRVDVEEEYLVAEDPVAERRAGDAKLVADQERTLDLDADTEAELTESLEEWHADHPGVRGVQ